MNRLNELYRIIYDSIQNSEYLEYLCKAENQSEFEDALMNLSTEIVNSIVDVNLDVFTKEEALLEQIGNIQWNIDFRQRKLDELNSELNKVRAE